MLVGDAHYVCDRRFSQLRVLPFTACPPTFPRVFLGSKSRKPTIRVLLFPSIQKKPRYLHVWLMNEAGRGLDPDDYHRCTLCVYSVPEAERRGREIGERGAPGKRGVSADGPHPWFPPA